MEENNQPPIVQAPHKNITKVSIFLSIIAILIIGIFSISKLIPPVQRLPIVKLLPTDIPQPTPKILKLIEHYDPPKIATSSSYTLIFVGDSMTESLGENFDYLRLNLKKYYPQKVFGLFNYGYGSSNLLSVDDRLHQDTSYLGKSFPAILDRYFDVILLESFGNNPLSEFDLATGLQKQSQALDHLVAELADTHPQSLIIFIATISPSQSLYGKGQVDLSPESRNRWANERRAYIENHINYAKRHNIPLINVYEKSMDKNGLTLTKYLHPSNYIHPSSTGAMLISQTIADYLFQNHILLN